MSTTCNVFLKRLDFGSKDYTKEVKKQSAQVFWTRLAFGRCFYIELRCLLVYYSFKQSMFKMKVVEEI